MKPWKSVVVSLTLFGSLSSVIVVGGVPADRAIIGIASLAVLSAALAGVLVSGPSDNAPDRAHNRREGNIG